MLQKDEAARKLVQETSKLAKERIQKERDDLQRLMEQRMNEEQRRLEGCMQKAQQEDATRIDGIISQQREIDKAAIEMRWQMEIAKFQAEKDAEAARQGERLRAEIARFQVRRNEKKKIKSIFTWRPVGRTSKRERGNGKQFGGEVANGSVKAEGTTERHKMPH